MCMKSICKKVLKKILLKNLYYYLEREKYSNKEYVIANYHLSKMFIALL